MPLTIRPARVSDTDALVKKGLCFIAGTGYRDILTPSVPHLEQLIAFMLVNGHVLVATLDGSDEPVGMLGAVPVTHPMTGRTVLSEVAWWLDPAYRRSKTAIQMLAQTEAFGRSIGADAIHMIAPAGSPVEHLYRRRDYVEVETTWQRRLR